MERALPQGVCYCGCGTPVGPSKFFVPTHDRIAEANLLAAEYGGSIANMLVAHDYGPGRKNLRYRGVDPEAIRAKYAEAEDVRPEELAMDLHVTGLAVRNFLRERFPRPANEKGSPWWLTNAQVGAVLGYFLSEPQVDPVLEHFLGKSGA
jgi:hypothetical protein